MEVLVLIVADFAHIQLVVQVDLVVVELAAVMVVVEEEEDSQVSF